MKYEFFIEKSKDNINILKLCSDEKKIYIGSKYKMTDYLNNFIKDIDKDSKKESVFLIYGMGAGEEIKIIRSNYPNNKIIIVEPIKELIIYLKNNKTKFKFLEDENLYIISGDDENISNSLKNLLGDYELDKIIFKCLINYDKVFKEKVLQFNELLKKVLIDKVIFRNTNILFAERWFETLIQNLKYIIRAIPVNYYENVFKNIPAVIVSAGPSLNKNIKQLHSIDNRMLIFSGGRTLKPLIMQKIKPNITGIVDAGETSFKLVDGYIDKVKCPLLMYEGTNEEVVKQHSGKKIFFTSMQDLKDIFSKDVFNLSEGGSVAHTLALFAIKSGCNPIIFIGQDFAYTNEKYHADIAINQFSTVEKNKIKDEEDFYVKDINGYMVRTSKVLDSFRRDMEKVIRKYPNTTFINATEGGANIEGTINMTLNESISKYKLNNDIKFNKLSNNINYNDIRYNCITMLKKALNSCCGIKLNCEKGLKLLDELYRYFKVKNKFKVDKILNRLQRLDEVITKEYKNLGILNALLYPIALAIMSQYKIEKDEDIIEKNRFLYKSILEKVEYAYKKIKNTLNEIENMEI